MASISGEQTGASEPTSNPARSDQGRIAAGTLIAERYRIEQWLGRGGMGAVYRAYDILKDRPVALKLLHRALSNETSQAKRFHREAQVLGRLRSPHVVTVYDHGRTDDGLLYLVMEYLEGETLQQRLQRLGHLPVAEALTILVAVLDGLAAVHHAGVVHRDVKPANIFLVRLPSGAWSTKLLDFGVAKIDMAESTELTKAGQLCGTPRFMSPEQVLDRPIDVRSDLFSAGVVLYLALTGAMPYESGTPAQLVYALMQSTPIPLTRRRADLATQTDLNRMVLHALDRTPTSRYQSAQEMAAELRVLLATEQTTPSSTPWWPRWLTPLSVRSAVIVVLLLAIVPFVELASATQVKYAGFAMNGSLVSPTFSSERQAQDVTPLFDQVVAIDGHPWHSASESYAYLAGLPLGTAVAYRLRRNGHERTVTMPVTQTSWRELRNSYGIHYLGGFLLILIGATVAWSRPRLASARAWLALTAMIGLSLLTVRSRDFSGPLSTVGIIAICIVGATFAHFALIHPTIWAPLRRHRALLTVFYAPSAAIVAAALRAQYDASYATIGLRSIGTSGFAGIALLLLRQNRLRVRGATVAVRQAARQMLWVAAPLVISGFVGALVGVTGTVSGTTYAISVTGLILFALGIGHQIWRGELFDLDLVAAQLVRGVLRYTLLVLIFSGVAGTVVVLLRLLGSTNTMEIYLAPLVGIAAVSLIYEPLMRRMSSVGRHGENDSAAAIAQFSSLLRSTAEALDVVDLLFEALQRRYRPQKLRLLEHDGSGYVVRSHDNSSVSRPALVADVRLEPGDSDNSPNGHGERLLSQTEIEHRVSRLGRLRAHAGLILPVAEERSAATQSGTRYRRILVLGPRGDGHAYSSEDAGLVAALVHLAAARLDTIGERAQRLDSFSEDSYDE